MINTPEMQNIERREGSSNSRQLIISGRQAVIELNPEELTAVVGGAKPVVEITISLTAPSRSSSGSSPEEARGGKPSLAHRALPRHTGSRARVTFHSTTRAACLRAALKPVQHRQLRKPCWVWTR